MSRSGVVIEGFRGRSMLKAVMILSLVTVPPLLWLVYLVWKTVTYIEDIVL